MLVPSPAKIQQRRFGIFCHLPSPGPAVKMEVATASRRLTAMANGQTSIAQDPCCPPAARVAGTEPSDGQLLERFARLGDQAAFAALVRRHGPMVLGVCRRVLRHAQDAEDAFQATFLVLVRKAASIVPREYVANWLYGAALRAAWKVRSSAARRRSKEILMATLPEREDEKRDL